MDPSERDIVALYQPADGSILDKWKKTQKLVTEFGRIEINCKFKRIRSDWMGSMMSIWLRSIVLGNELGARSQEPVDKEWQRIDWLQLT